MLCSPHPADCAEVRTAVAAREVMIRYKRARSRLLSWKVTGIFKAWLLSFFHTSQRTQIASSWRFSGHIPRAKVFKDAFVARLFKDEILCVFFTTIAMADVIVVIALLLNPMRMFWRLSTGEWRVNSCVRQRISCHAFLLVHWCLV